jgi:hypothetical protein
MDASRFAKFFRVLQQGKRVRKGTDGWQTTTVGAKQ